MNTSANNSPSVPTAAPASPHIIPTKTLLYWSVRRELWEHRSIMLVPLVAAGLALIGMLISVFRLPASMRATLAQAVDQQSSALATPYRAVAGMLIMISFFIAVFYCLDSLYGERRERGVLFWKSLPVSDWVTVLSKASIPMVVLPLYIFIVILALQLCMLLLSTVVVLVKGLSVAMLWANVPLLQMTVVMFYGIAVNVLWAAPIYSWLLLVSAWARRAPFLWAVLPPLAICFVEWIATGKSFFGHVLNYRFFGAMSEAFNVRPQASPVPNIDRLSQLDPVKFFTSPGLWLGLLFAAACLAAAVWLRRNREPL